MILISNSHLTDISNMINTDLKFIFRCGSMRCAIFTGGLHAPHVVLGGHQVGDPWLPLHRNFSGGDWAW